MSGTNGAGIPNGTSSAGSTNSGGGGGAAAGGTPNDALILVVEDDEAMRRFLRATLQVNGYRVAESVTAEHAMNFAELRRPDLVLLDLGLPDLDGMAVLQRLRAWFGSPVVVVSARPDEDDKVAALDAGANDYLTKPFGTPELLARIRAALRQANRLGIAAEQGVFTTGELRVDCDRHEVSVRGTPVRLTPLEYRLLRALIQHADKVVTHKQLLREVWGEAHLEEAHYLRVYMSALRRKLEDNPAQPRYLVTEQNVGYRLRRE